MDYTFISKNHKRAIDAMVLKDPSLKTANTITRKQVEALVKEIRASDPQFKYPAFIEKGTKVARATYLFPGPYAEPYSTSPDLKAIKSAADVQFEEEFEKEMSDLV